MTSTHPYSIPFKLEGHTQLSDEYIRRGRPQARCLNKGGGGGHSPRRETWAKKAATSLHHPLASTEGEIGLYIQAIDPTRAHSSSSADQ